MKHTILFCIFVCIQITFLGAAAHSDAASTQKKSWIGKLFTQDTTHSFWQERKESKKVVTRTVSFAGRSKGEEARMPRSQSAPQKISQLALQEIIETPLIPDKLPSLFHEHLFYACYNFLKAQIERLPETTITDSFPLRIKLYTICSTITIDAAEAEEKSVDERIRTAIDSMRSELSTIFYTYILETVYENGPPGPVYDAFHDVFNEIMSHAQLSENLSIKPPLDEVI